MTFPTSTPRTPQEFADFLWSPYAKGNVAVASCNVLSKDFHHYWSSVDTTHRLMADAAHLAQHSDVYFSVAAFLNKKRTCEEVQRLKWLWADLDDHAIASDIPNPTLLMQTSSGRAQALWYLAGIPDADAVEERVRAIAAACDLGNAAVAANQVLRVPGTINHKPERNGYLVRVEEYRPGAVYRLEDFAHLAAGSVPLSGTGTVKLISSGEAFALWPEAYRKLSYPKRNLAFCHDVLKANGTAYKSPSEADGALITAFVRLGYSPSQAGALFLISERGKWCVKRHRKRDAVERASKYAANAAELIKTPQPPISLPSSIFEASLGFTDIAVFAIQSEHSYGNGRTWYGQGNIAEKLSLDRKTIAPAIARLREKGFLQCDGTVQRANRYRLKDGDVTIPVSAVHTILERTDAKGLAVSLALIGGHTTKAALASALSTTRQTISPIIDRLIDQEIITATIAARGLQKYAIAQML